MDWFDLMSSAHFHVILHQDKKHGLIFNRLDGSIATINHDDAKELSNLKRMGRVYGIIGRYLNNYLVLIKNRALVGSIYEPNTKTEHKIFVITQVQVVDISCSTVAAAENSKIVNSVRYDVASSDVQEKTGATGSCQAATESTSSLAHEDFSSLPITISTSSYASRAAPWNPFKLASSLKPRMPTQFLKSSGTDSINGDGTSGSSNLTGRTSPSQTNNQVDDSDKRLIEEMMKLFNNTDSFYFSPTLDLTNRFSRKANIKNSGSDAIWRTADERFFWNKYMLKDFIELCENNKDANYFICVILQGFIAIKHHTVSLNPFDNNIVDNNPLSSTSSCDNRSIDLEEKKYLQNRIVTRNYQLALISRRSVFQAGTRYRRRGCDEEGNCANFVETEQIFRYNHHFTSFIILRGSIPLFWYQTGYNYRPPPVLFRGEEENHQAFVRHFSNLIQSYETDNIIAVDCTEQTGREKSLHDSYKRHIGVLQNSISNLKLIEFDFHKYCRGRQNSYIQVEKFLKLCGCDELLLKKVKYYWNDGDVVWNQEGIFRVNCLDCSDRTNVVQRAIALQILDLQLARLGIISPDTNPEDNECRKIMHQLWSTNGNVLSTQYCGTKALFGEDTRLSGYIKDTYSSASRYYFSKFRDVYRQAAIDAMLGRENVDEKIRAPGQKDQLVGVDQYELISLEPILSGKAGSALLRDVGSRVSNRLARLKGRFYVKPFVSDHISVSREATEAIDEADPELTEGTVRDALDGLNIDWPSTESVENIDNLTNNAFNQLSKNEDSFQDDEFGQLMLSIELSELQRLKDNEHQKVDNNGSEEINMTETCGIKSSSTENSGVTTSTTSA